MQKQMSQSSTNGSGGKSRPKQLAVSAGKYGGIITAVLLACQILDQIQFMP